MKFAVSTAENLRSARPGKEAWLIEYGAAPLLEVARAVISDEGQCRICTEDVGPKTDGEHGYMDNGEDCPVPAALAAMEEV